MIRLNQRQNHSQQDIEDEVIDLRFKLASLQAERQVQLAQIVRLKEEIDAYRGTLGELAILIAEAKKASGKKERLTVPTLSMLTKWLKLRIVGIQGIFAPPQASNTRYASTQNGVTPVIPREVNLVITQIKASLRGER